MNQNYYHRSIDPIIRKYFYLLYFELFIHDTLTSGIAQSNYFAPRVQRIRIPRRHRRNKFTNTSAAIGLYVHVASASIIDDRSRFAGYHQATCTSRPTWQPRRQVVWYHFRRRSWATQPPSPRRRSSTSTRTRRRPQLPTRAPRTTSPRRIRTRPQPRLVRVWIVSRVRVATTRYTITTNTTNSSNSSSKTVPRRWRISNGWRKLSYRNFCRPCCVITVENLQR